MVVDAIAKKEIVMTLKDFLNEAIIKGETMKDEIVEELLKSKVLQEVFSHDLFAKAVSTVLKTKKEVSSVVKANVKSVLQIMDIPTRHDLSSIERKLGSLESSVDKIGKKTIKVNSLKKAPVKRAAKAKKK